VFWRRKREKGDRLSCYKDNLKRFKKMFLFSSLLDYFQANLIISQLNQENSELKNSCFQVSRLQTSDLITSISLPFYFQLKEEIFDLQGSMMMATAEARHEAEKEIATNKSELNLRVQIILLIDLILIGN
jgi:hypothetical protein